uniref:Ubiquitin carboxyl-terminal hydrolase n=1 Tax=Caligus clemensi TaxID=344056 RepID=C1C2U4_CALCM|nr:YPL191C [Caligus clemensi]
MSVEQKENTMNEEETNQTESKDDIYHVKWITWKEKIVPVLTQNANGPCPLISLINVLLLRGSPNEAQKCGLKGSETIRGSILLDYLGNAVLHSVPRTLSEDDKLNYEANISDAIHILPRLQYGLDVNVKFTGVRHFEYTKEVLPFDLLNISLYHGWLVDPQSEEAPVVGDLSYNALVEKVISDSAALGKHFLESSASQLTYHGLCELTSAMEKNEIAVFFRNNHFSTITKHNERLYLLVTDQGFLKESRVVWETLDSVNGDISYVDDHFNVLVPLSPSTSNYSQENSGTSQQIDQDHLLAVSVQREDYKEEFEGMSTLSDAEIAQKLQDKEIESAARSSEPAEARSNSSASVRPAQRRGSSSRGSSAASNIKKKCCIS